MRTVLVKARAQRPFTFIGPVQTDKTKESLVEIANKELRGILGEKPVVADELAKTQANETLKLPGSRETLDALEATIDDQVQYGLADDYYQTYAAKVRALTVPDVEAAAKTVVHPDNIIWIVVGDRAKNRAGNSRIKLRRSAHSQSARQNRAVAETREPLEQIKYRDAFVLL